MYICTRSTFLLPSNPAMNWWPSTSWNFSGHAALSWCPSLVYSTIVRPFCLKLKTRLKKRVWSTSFWTLPRQIGKRKRFRVTANSLAFRDIGRGTREVPYRVGLFRNMTRVAVSFRFSSLYTWPSTAKFKFWIYSAGSSRPPSSLTSRPKSKG